MAKYFRETYFLCLFRVNSSLNYAQIFLQKPILCTFHNFVCNICVYQYDMWWAYVNIYNWIQKHFEMLCDFCVVTAYMFSNCSEHVIYVIKRSTHISVAFVVSKVAVERGFLPVFPSSISMISQLFLTHSFVSFIHALFCSFMHSFTH
jgi:hypothetical protein